MSTTRTSLLVLSLLAGLAYSVDAYVETRQPLEATPHLVERGPADAEDPTTPELHALELSAGAETKTQA